MMCGHPGDAASAVALLEASVRQFEERLGLRQVEVVNATKRANSLFETLDASDKAKARFAAIPLPIGLHSSTWYCQQASIRRTDISRPSDHFSSIFNALRRTLAS